MVVVVVVVVVVAVVVGLREKDRLGMFSFLELARLTAWMVGTWEDMASPSPAEMPGMLLRLTPPWTGEEADMGMASICRFRWLLPPPVPELPLEPALPCEEP